MDKKTSAQFANQRSPRLKFAKKIKSFQAKKKKEYFGHSSKESFKTVEKLFWTNAQTILHCLI